MSHLYQNYPSWWNANDHQISESLSQSLTLKVNSPPQLRLNVTPLGFQLQDQDSSSSQSTQSNQDLMTVTAGVNSQDQCMSSESGQEVNGGNNLGTMKPVYMMGHPETASNPAHIDYGPTVAYMPHPCGDPYFNGIFSASAYGSAPGLQTQFIGVTNARVPLPLDMAEDEPIYVNAKQYHGILRRRQSRAKLEAQNKLIRARKPYLHESRHRHALNRVRGTGGRFLSTKKLQQSDSNLSHDNHSNSNLNPFGHSNATPLGFESYHQPQCIETGSSNMSSANAFYQQTDGGFLGMSMQPNGGFMDGTNQHRAPVVR